MSTSQSTVSFGVSARLVAILGQHLIRDNTVGLMELIKNGYDADADQVSVEMYDLNRPEQTLIVVEDNGGGMTREILTGPWLTVAHGHKEVSKAAAERSARGRTPLGEKGVGRFAVHKLGRRLQLITRPHGQTTELVLDVDWDAFETTGENLQSIPLQLTERLPQHFVGVDAHGTRLEMTVTRDKWHRKDVAKLQASLMRLTNPRFGVSDFKVTLRCPDFEMLEDLTTDDITDKFQFRLDCRVDEYGLAIYEYRWRDEARNVQTVSDATMLWQDPTAGPACGPVSIQLCAWLMHQKTLHDLGTSREQMAVLSGISIYRDGFRILPYGDQGDDWLGLDARRINNPTIRFGNRQIIGSIGIDQVHNQALMDKTNREGLQENQAYEDLRKLVMGALNMLEQVSLNERQRQNRAVVEHKQQLVQDIERLDNAVRTLTRPAEQSRPMSAVREWAADNEILSAESAPAPQQVVVDLEHVRELTRAAAAVKAATAQIAESQEGERDTYLRLIGSGLAAERFAHEVDRQMARALDACERLRHSELAPAAAEAARQMDTFVNSLRNELRLMGQVRYVRRSQRATQVSVRKIAELLLLSYDEQFSALAVDVNPWLADDFTVFMSEASVAQVIDNLLDNAVYWLGQSQPTDGRRLTIELNSGTRTLQIINNGPAVDGAIRGRLFEQPFTTTKHDGHGMGLYLSAEIMKRAGGAVSVIPKEQLTGPGAGFVVSFPAAAHGEEA